MRAFLLIAALASAPSALLAQPSTTALSDTVPITEWRVPWERSRPRDPFPDGRGTVWFVGQQGNYIATLEPASGRFKRYEMDEGVHPHNLILDRRGAVWYAGNQAAHIGRLDPATGKVTKFPMPDSGARDPHTLVLDAAGDIWFTVQGGNFVGRLTTRSGAVRLFRPSKSGARPYGIALDSKGRVWFDEFGTNAIGTIDPRTLQLTEIPLPNERARPRRIAVTSDDAVWYVDYSRGYLGRVDPRTRQVREWPAPAGAASLPYAMAADDLDRLWFVETGVQPNRLVGFDPRLGSYFSITPIGSGGGTVRHMVFDPGARQLWFGTDANTIGRATVPPRGSRQGVVP